MAISFSRILLLVAVLLLTTTTTFRPISAAETSPPPQPPSLPTTPPPPPVSTAQTPPPPPISTAQDPLPPISTSQTPPQPMPISPPSPVSTVQTPPPPPPPSVSTPQTPPPSSVSTAQTPPPSSVSTSQTPPPPPSPASTSRNPRPQTLAEIQQSQLNNIIDALIGAGDFAGWANLLSSTDPSSLPLTATLFIPTNDAISAAPSSSANTTTAGIMTFDPLLVAYHIVPQRLTFSDLTQFSTHTRLPTLLPEKYIVITNNSNTNFTIDDSRIIQADVFVNVAFSVHGVQKVLDYSLYSGNPALSPPPEKPHFPGEIIVDLSSAAPCYFSWVSISLSTICAAALAIKILQQF